MKSSLLICTLLISSSSFLFAQHWLPDQAAGTKSTQAELDFYEIQQSFNHYWDGKAYEKGKGYKQYKRWEWLMEPRVYPSGNLNLVNQARDLPPLSEEFLLHWAYRGPESIPLEINTMDVIRGMGRLNCIEFHPYDPQTFWVGAASGGIWKTSDGGTSFIPLSDDLLSIGISDILVHPEHADTLFILSGDKDGFATYTVGLFRSYDGGQSWQETAIKNDVTARSTMNKLLMDPGDPSRQYAATRTSILLTTDNWDSYTSLAASDDYKDMEMNPGNPDILYVATNHGDNESRILRSVDRGASFQVAMNGISFPPGVNIGRIELAVSPARPDAVYALLSNGINDGYYGLLYSPDAGESWTWLNSYATDGLNYLGRSQQGTDEGGQAWYDMTLEVSPRDADEIWIGGINIWYSRDFGSAFQYASQEEPFLSWIKGIHVDQHEIRYNPHTNELYACHDGGISKMTEITGEGAIWKTLPSRNLGILQIYRMDVSQQDVNLAITGNQDNGTFRLRDDSWKSIGGGDGMQCLIDYSDDEIMYFSSQYGNFYKSTDQGMSFSFIKPASEGNNNGAWITPLEMNPQNPNELIVGFTELLKTTNSGTSWSYITSRGADSNIDAIAYAPSNPQYIYYSDGANIYGSDNGGGNWSVIGSDLPVLYIEDINVSALDPKHLWICFSGYDGSSKVYESKDAGASWQNYSAGLPNLPVNTMVEDTLFLSALYAGTDVGVYYRSRAMNEWVNVSHGLPNVIVNDLEIQREERQLLAGTYGRGLWQTDLIVDPSQVFVDFSVEANTICTGFTSTFSYKGSMNYDSLLWQFANGNEWYESREQDPQISFTQEGSPTISLTLFKDGESLVERREAYMTVGKSLEVDFEVKNEYPCADSAIIYGSAPGEYHWTPTEGLSGNNQGSIVKSYPDHTTTYYIEVTQGDCSYTDSVTIKRVSNNNVCDAISIPYGLSGPHANYCTWTELGEPSPLLNGCETQNGWCEGEGPTNSVWFNFEADASGEVSIISWGFDNQIALYDAENCTDLLSGNFTVIAANDDYHTSDYSAVIETVSGLTPGKKYWIQVDGSFGGVSGEFTLRLISSISGIDVEDQPMTGALKIYPNPSEGVFNVELPANGNKGRMQVYDMAGRIIYTSVLMNPVQGTTEQIDLTSAETGLYLLHLWIDNEFYGRAVLID